MAVGPSLCLLVLLLPFKRSNNSPNKGGSISLGLHVLLAGGIVSQFPIRLSTLAFSAVE